MKPEIIIGIDVGGSTTKIVGMRNNEVIEPILIHAKDPITSLFGAFGKFLYQHSIDLSSVKKVMITGVGATFINDNIYGIETIKVPEFDANALGGLYLSEKDKAIVVSLGTGTSIVEATKGVSNTYIGGTGVGGGTIIGLCNKLIGVTDIEKIINIAKKGDLSKVDLSVGDIVNTNDLTKELGLDLTASNFGKFSADSTNADIALGVLNLVFQSIAMTAAFASKGSAIEDVVLIGNLSRLEVCKVIFEEIHKITGVNFIFPKMSEFGTALGAVLYK